MILVEEVGECARCALEGDTLALTAELVNVAAVAVAWLERLELEGRQPPLRLTSIVRSVKGLSR